MLNSLLKKITEGKIISNDMFDENNIDELLDMRDEPQFDSEWMRVYNQLEKTTCSETDKQIIDKIRKESYLKAYEAANSSDIASCVSDDFDLLSRAYALSINDYWLSSVILEYVRNKFPCGEIKQNKIDIAEAFEMLIE